jgi:hypothetical protein
LRKEEQEVINSARVRRPLSLEKLKKLGNRRIAEAQEAMADSLRIAHETSRIWAYVDSSHDIPDLLYVGKTSR